MGILRGGFARRATVFTSFNDDFLTNELLSDLDSTSRLAWVVLI